MRCFLYGFLGFFLAAIVAAFAMATYGDYAARASLSDTMQSMAPLQNQIAGIILAQGTVVDAGTSLDPPMAKQSFPKTDYLKVSANGSIVFRSSKHGQIIVLEPTFQASAVGWRCLDRSQTRICQLSTAEQYTNFLRSNLARKSGVIFHGSPDMATATT